MFQSFQQNFPTGAIVSPQTGILTTIGKYFLQSLYNRTGQSTGLPSVSDPLTAAGTTQATALLLANDWNDVETVATGSGVVMPSMQPGADIIVFNGSGTALNVYPFSGAKIDGGAVNAAFSLGGGKLRLFQCWSITQIRTAYQSP